MTKIPEEQLGPWALSAEATDTPKGRRFSVTFSILAEHAVIALDLLEDEALPHRGAMRLLPYDVAEHMNLTALMTLLSRQLEGASVGRPGADYSGLMRVYTQWLASKSPKHGDREFARRHMGAGLEDEIRAALEKLRRARKWWAARNSALFSCRHLIPRQFRADDEMI